MAQEKKFFDRTRETATRLEAKLKIPPKFKLWWDRNVLPKWRKFNSWLKNHQEQFFSFTVLCFFCVIVLSALCGNAENAKIVNTVFRIIFFAEILRILRTTKTIREALSCVLLLIAIAAGLSYLGLANPKWLERVWELMKEPDFVGWYKAILNWLFEEIPFLLPW